MSVGHPMLAQPSFQEDAEWSYARTTVTGGKLKRGEPQYGLGCGKRSQRLWRSRQSGRLPFGARILGLRERPSSPSYCSDRW